MMKRKTRQRRTRRTRRPRRHRGRQLLLPIGGALHPIPAPWPPPEYRLPDLETLERIDREAIAQGVGITQGQPE